MIGRGGRGGEPKVSGKIQPVSLAFQFTLPAKAAGEKTAAQIKAPLKDILLTYGPVDEVRVAPAADGKLMSVPHDTHHTADSLFVLY